MGFRASDLNATIASSSVTAEGGRIWRLKYAIDNKSIASLKTVVTEWTVRSTETGEETKFQRAVDSWIQGRRVAGPLGSGLDDIQLRFEGAGGVEIVNIEVLYAEYDDGSVEGAAASCIRNKFLESREAIVTKAKEIQAKLRLEVPLAEIRKLLAADPDIQYILLETVGGQSAERIGAAAVRIANQPK